MRVGKLSRNGWLEWNDWEGGRRRGMDWGREQDFGGGGAHGRCWDAPEIEAAETQSADAPERVDVAWRERTAVLDVATGAISIARAFGGDAAGGSSLVGGHVVVEGWVTASEKETLLTTDRRRVRTNRRGRKRRQV